MSRAFLAACAVAVALSAAARITEPLYTGEFQYGLNEQKGDTRYAAWREQARAEYFAPGAKLDRRSLDLAVDGAIVNGDEPFAAELVALGKKTWPKDRARWAEAEARVAMASGDRKGCAAKLRERLSLGCRPDETNALVRQIAVIERGVKGFDEAIAKDGLDALGRLRALRATSRALFLLRDWDGSTEIRDEILNKCYKTFRRRTCKARYVADCPKSAEAFAHCPLYRDWKNYQSDFYAYGGARGCFADEDEKWHLVGTVEPEINKDYPSGIQVLFDDRGVEIFIRCDDPKVAEKRLGKGDFGTLEIFFAPGDWSVPYRTIFFCDMPSTSDPHNCEWACAGQNYVRNADAFTKDCAVTAEGCVAHISFPWLSNFDSLPFDGRKWNLGVSRWGDCGGQTIGGVVHELGCGMQIDFDIPASLREKLMRSICKAGYNRFRAWRADPLSEFSRLWDASLGDPAFMTSVNPVVKELDAIGESLDKASVSELERCVKETLPRWVAFRYELALLRANWLDDQMFAE